MKRPGSSSNRRLQSPHPTLITPELSIVGTNTSQESVSREAKSLLNKWMNNDRKLLLSSVEVPPKLQNIPVETNVIQSIILSHKSDKPAQPTSGGILEKVKDKKPSELSQWQKLRVSMEKKKKPETTLLTPSVFDMDLNQPKEGNFYDIGEVIINRVSPTSFTPTFESDVLERPFIGSQLAVDDSIEKQMQKFKSKLLGADFTVDTKEEKKQTPFSETKKKSKVEQPKNNFVTTQKEIFLAENEKRKVEEEVERIRKQIEEEKNKLKEVQDIKKQELKSIKQNQQIKEDMERVRQQQMKILKEHEKERAKMLDKMTDDILQNNTLTMKSKYFNIWAKRCSKRFQMLLKSKTIFEWKTKKRAFKGLISNWKENKELKEKKSIERQILSEKKKIQAAEQFYRSKALSTFFLRWTCKYKISRDKKIIEKHHSRRREMMNNFIEKMKENNVAKQETEMAQLHSVVSALVPKTEELPQVRKSKTSRKETAPNTSPIPRDPSTIPPQALSTSENVVEILANTEQEPKDKILVKKIKNLPPPAFLKTMEDRVSERKERWKQLQEKYKQQEEDKEKVKQEEEKKKQEDELEKKRLALEEKRKEKEQQKLKALEKEKRLLDAQAKLEKARCHYHRTIMKNRILKPLIALVKDIKEKERMANGHYCSNIGKFVFIGLRANIIEERELRKDLNKRKIQQLIRKHEIRSLSRSLKGLKQNVRRNEDMLEEAAAHYRHAALSTCLKQWKRSMRLMKEDRLLKKHENKKKADQFYTSHLLRVYFRNLRSHIQEEKFAREKEQQGKQLKEKVRGWLEDFKIKQDIDW